MEQLESAWKIEGISPSAYQHPADRAATAALKKVPYLDEVVRKLVALGYERALRAAALGSAVRLGQEQLPGIWVLHRQVFNTLDIERVPDLYMTQFPLANAYTIGTSKPIVLLNSELVRILDGDGHRVVSARYDQSHVARSRHGCRRGVPADDLLAAGGRAADDGGQRRPRHAALGADRARDDRAP